MAICTVALVAFVMSPMLMGRRNGAPRAAYDMQVYRDQMQEIERDLARGNLSAADAAASRAEIGRRLLQADDAARAAKVAAGAPRWLNLTVMLGLTAACVAGAFLVYQRVGVPGYPDLPLAQRQAREAELRAQRPSQETIEAMIANDDTGQLPLPMPNTDPQLPALVDRLKEALQDHQDDLQGQRYMADYSAQLARFEDAWRAQQKVIEILGDQVTAYDHIELAELMILAARGYVSPQAEAAIRAGLALDGRDLRGRYYAGLTMAQGGRPDLAWQIWTSVQADSPPNAPWLPSIAAQLNDVAAAARAMGSNIPDAGTMPEDPQAQADMIRGMVEGLAARLAEDGGPASDWARLIRALNVLGETERADAIEAEARQRFAADPESIAQIDAAKQ